MLRFASSSTYTMITARNTYEVNKNAIKVLSNMIIRHPRGFRVNVAETRESRVNVSAALHEFIMLLNEQSKLVEAKIQDFYVGEQGFTALAWQLKKDYLTSGDTWDWQNYPRAEEQAKYYSSST